MRLGYICPYDSLPEGIAFAREAGLETIQLRVRDAAERTKDELERVRAGMRELPFESVTAGWAGPAVWDFRRGPLTLGVVPEEYRAGRMISLFKAMEWAHELSIPLVQTHFGFIPENPCDPAYAQCVDLLGRLGRRAEELGIVFCLEAGQETPVTLLRAILDAGSPALGVNLDTANLLMYGRGDPLTAVTILGERIRSLHLKDGTLPEGDMYSLGEETVIGQGMVDFPGLFSRLKAIGFDGPMFIEREIAPPRQLEDIRACVPLLRRWMAGPGLDR